jgi:hypothetical protein
LDYLGSQSRIVSSMIAGPANFPVARMEKRNRAAMNKANALQEFDNRAMKAIVKRFSPELVEKRIGDKSTGGAIKTELEQRKETQEIYKRINANVRKIARMYSVDKDAEPSEEAVQALARAASIKPELARAALTYDRGYGYGIPSFRLRNNNAMIRRLELQAAKQESYEAQAAAAQAGERQTRYEIPSGGHVELNYDDNRLQLFFPGKPSYDEREKLKQNGFRWAPSLGAWQRQLTENAKYAARQLTGLNIR